MAAPSVLLYPGAGSDRNHSRLLRVEADLGGRDAVDRHDFPYRSKGSRRTEHRN